MFPIGESLAIRNLERAVSAGNGNSPPGTAVPTLRPGVRPSPTAPLEPAVSAGNGFLRAGNDPPGTAVSRQKHGGCL